MDHLSDLFERKKQLQDDIIPGLRSELTEHERVIKIAEESAKHSGWARPIPVMSDGYGGFYFADEPGRCLEGTSSADLLVYRELLRKQLREAEVRLNDLTLECRERSYGLNSSEIGGYFGSEYAIKAYRQLSDDPSINTFTKLNGVMTGAQVDTVKRNIGYEGDGFAAFKDLLNRTVAPYLTDKSPDNHLTQPEIT